MPPGYPLSNPYGVVSMPDPTRLFQRSGFALQLTRHATPPITCPRPRQVASHGSSHGLSHGLSHSHSHGNPQTTRGGLRLALVATLTAWVALAIGGVAFPARGEAGEITLRDQELPTRLTVGYAVRLLDMNGDKRLDIAIVDSDRILWLENPNWNEHILTVPGQTKKDNVCFAPADIDGDGQLDFAVGADWRPFDTNTGGTIQWIRRGDSPGKPWNLYPIGEEPTVHRMQFADLDGDSRPELIVSPLMGRGTTRPSFQEKGVRLLAYSIPADPVKGPWTPHVLDDALHVSHNIAPTDIDGDGRTELLVVSFEGVHLLERPGNAALGTSPWRRTRIGTGNQETSPNRGASEIKRGQLAKGDYIATIEPWHGSQVVVYTRPESPRPATGEWLWRRQVLDDKLLWGHGVVCANLDSDPEEELLIGVRDDQSPENRRGLRVYDPRDAAGTTWSRTVVDPGSVAIEDLAAGDLNGDGRVDVVAVGRQTHNVKIYWNETK